jgi:hypothetical protein
VISSNKAGGAVTAVDNEKNLFITLGHEGTQSGVMAENLKNRATFTARFEPNVVRRSQSVPNQAQQQSHATGSQPPAEGKGVTTAPAPAAGWHSGRKIP